MSAIAQLLAAVNTGMAPMPPTPSVLETPMPQSGGKCQHHSYNQSAPTCKGQQPDEEEAVHDEEVMEECPWWKCKEGKALKESWKEAFSKESNLIKVARWVYLKTHQANFEQEGSYDLYSISHQMATSTNLLNAEVYEVQETWGSQKDLKAINWVARTLPKDIHFFGLSHPWSHQRSWASRASIP